MKKNSIKILALVALALSLGACGSGGGKGSSSEATSSSAQQSESQSQEQSSEQSQEQSSEQSQEQSSEQSQEESSEQSQEESSEEGSSEEQTPTTYTIGEILSIEQTAPYAFEHEGELVRVEHMGLQAKYGNTLVAGVYTGSGVPAIQVDCVEFPEFEGSGWGADLTFEGVLHDVDGRAVITDATVTVNSETDRIPIYGYNSFSRGTLDRLGRGDSGFYSYGTTFQLASLPETLETGKEQTFYMVFPGENLDLEDPDNYSPIAVRIPAELDQKACDAFNTLIEGLKVGDFIVWDGCGEYRDSDYGMNFVLDHFAARYCTIPEVKPEIYNTWDDVAAVANKYYNEQVPNLGNDKVFSYTFDYDGAATDAWKAEYVFLDDVDNAVSGSFTFNYKATDAKEIVDGFDAKLLELGWEALTGDNEGIYTLTVEEKCVGEIILTAASETGLGFAYIAAKPIVAEFPVEAVVEFFGEYDIEVTVPSYPGEGAAFEIDDSHLEDGYFDVYVTNTSETDLEAYKTLLTENGWFVVAEAEGDYKLRFGTEEEPTDAYVDLINYLADEEDPCVLVSFFYRKTVSAEFGKFADLKEAYEARAKAVLGAEDFASALVDIEAAATTYFLGWANETAWYEKYGDKIYRYGIEFDFETLEEGTVLAYEAALELAGFEPKRLDDYAIDGLFNADTNEFVYGFVEDLDEKYIAFNVCVLTDDMVETYIIDIPELISLDQLTGIVEAAASAEIAAITGNQEATYTMSFAVLLAGEAYDGFEFVYGSQGAYAEYYASLGLITQYVVDAHVADGEVNAAALALIADLEEAGFVEAQFTLFKGAEGYFNANTNEFVMVDTTDTAVRLQFFILDATSASRVVPANAE